MKVEIDSSAFSEAVSWTTRIIPARPATPILTGVKLEAADGTLQLSAFDYEISARHHIEAGIDADGTVVVQGKLLAEREELLINKWRKINSFRRKIHFFPPADA